MEKGTKVKIFLAIIIFISIIAFVISAEISNQKETTKIIQEKAKEDASMDENIRAFKEYDGYLNVFKFDDYFWDTTNMKNDTENSIKEIFLNAEYEEIEYNGERKESYGIGLNNKLYFTISFENKMIITSGSYSDRLSNFVGNYIAYSTRYYKISDEDFLLLENALNGLFE